jgi:hypothetical protein
MVAARASRGGCLPNSLVCNSSGRPRGPPVREVQSRATSRFTRPTRARAAPGGCRAAAGPHKNNTHVRQTRAYPRPLRLCLLLYQSTASPLFAQHPPHPASLNPPAAVLAVRDPPACTTPASPTPHGYHMSTHAASAQSKTESSIIPMARPPTTPTATSPPSMPRL